MDFSGEKAATVDDKGRVVFPSEFKQEMGGNIPDGKLVVEMDPYVECLNIYTTDEWKKHLDDVLSVIDPNDEDDAELLDHFYRRFKKLAISDNGRINLPDDFMREKNIGKEVIFIGRGNMIRLWAKEESVKYFNNMNFKEKFREKMKSRRKTDS